MCCTTLHRFRVRFTHLDLPRFEMKSNSSVMLHFPHLRSLTMRIMWCTREALQMPESLNELSIYMRGTFEPKFHFASLAGSELRSLRFMYIIIEIFPKDLI